VAVHCGGVLVSRLRANLQKAGIELVHSRNNPFDLVPNIGGFNNLSCSSLWRSLKAKGLVFGENGGNYGISPHTLPYLGIHSYHKQLELGGYSEMAKRVKRYIAERDRMRRHRRGK
jgi:hypothetical protein